LALNKLTLDNINLFYDDLNGGTVFKIVNLNHKGKGDFASAILDYTSSTAIEKVSASQGLITYLKEATLNLESIRKY
jgi:hypothetical protein